MRAHLLLRAPLLVLALSPVSALADTAFTLNGILNNDGSTPSISGSFLLNTTTGLVSSASVDVPGYNTFFPTTISQSTSGNISEIDLQGLVTSSSIDFRTPLFIELFAPVPSLVGYTGGSLCSQQVGCGNLQSTLLFVENPEPFITGALRPTETLPLPPPPPVSSVPEPSSVVLLGSGVLAIAGHLRRRLLQR